MLQSCSRWCRRNTGGWRHMTHSPPVVWGLWAPSGATAQSIPRYRRPGWPGCIFALLGSSELNPHSQQPDMIGETNPTHLNMIIYKIKGLCNRNGSFFVPLEVGSSSSRPPGSYSMCCYLRRLLWHHRPHLRLQRQQQSSLHV